MKASSADTVIRPGSAQASALLRVRVAWSFFARARGLIGRPPPLPGHGLLLPDVAMVHGFGMRHSIDVLFLDSQCVIVKCARLAPRTIRWCARARHVVELRTGESSRLGFVVGMRVRPVPVDDIFAGPEATVAAEPAPAVSRSGRRRSAVRDTALVAAIFGWWGDAGSFAAQPGAVHPRGSVTSEVMPAQLALTRPLAGETLQRLEDEAETLYQAEGRQSRGDAELIGLYETLAQVRADRASHAWLRIGNIHQRSGSVGAAMDAYRRALSGAGASLPGATVRSRAEGSEAENASADASRDDAGRAAGDAATLSAQRKALLNLAGLALDQARQSLRRLESPAHRPGDRAGREAGIAASAQGSTTVAAQGDALYHDYHGQLRTLDRQLARQQERGSDPIAPGVLAQPGPTSDHAAPLPYHVDRYTASARRNAVKSARGSLHLDPADAMPAKQVARGARRQSHESLPRIEYLLGDPGRFTQGSGGRDPAEGKGGRN